MGVSSNDADRHIMIRLATPDDLSKVRNLLVATWHDTYDSLLGVERVTETTKEWHALDVLAAQAARPNTSFLVASQDGEVVGHTFVVEQDEGVLLLSRLYVLPNRQRQGIGEGLLRAAVTVGFAGRSGSAAVGRGILPRGETETWNSEGVKETREKATIYSLFVQFKVDVEPAHTVDWLENVDSGGYVWTGTQIKDKRETVETRAVGSGESRIELSSSRGGGSVGHGALEMTIGGVPLYLCLADENVRRQHTKAGYIIYRGEPEESVRKRIRDVLAFCLGRCLVYLGCTTLDAKSELISMTGQSADAFGGEVFEIPPLPPAPLGTQYQNEVDQRVLSRMADAIYAKYDDLRFGELSWAYWHAVCAPVHMAAAHFGAAIEALQSAYVESHSDKFQTKVVEDARKWSALRGELLKAVDEVSLDASARAKLRNKVSNLNQMPRSATSEALLSVLGIELSPIERAAWSRRNMAAHGGRVEDEAVVDVIRATKLLRIILCRMILRITGASETYHDYYTVGQPTRRLLEPVPSAA